MIFNRSYTFRSKYSPAEIKKNLLGAHLSIHKLDFEVIDKEHMLKIIPHAENVQDVKTLPITHVSLKSKSDGVRVKVSSHPRRIDVGGPMLLATFCILAMLGGLGLYVFIPNESIYLPGGLFAVGLIIFILFWIQMERGYFDYVRKIKSFVKKHC